MDSQGTCYTGHPVYDDVFAGFLSEYDSFTKQMTCLFMHNIPALICIGALIIAWKWELTGGILFIIIFIAAGIFFHSFSGNPASLIVINPFLIVGILFIISGAERKKVRSAI